MNIAYCPQQNVTDLVGVVVCPGCKSPLCRKHGFYLRKGFHTQNRGVPIVLKIARYLCRNQECPWCTFSVPPPMVMRYCRFFWPDLLSVNHALAAGSPPDHLALNVWHVGLGVIERAAALLDRLGTRVEGLHRELTDGRPVRKLEVMVKIITAKLGRLELTQRWYRHRYPRRFLTKSGTTQFDFRKTP